MTRFYTGAEACLWLRETALRGYDVPEFQSFVLNGNEDCPLRVALYRDADPEYDDEPVMRLALVTGADNLATYQAE